MTGFCAVNSRGRCIETPAHRAACCCCAIWLCLTIHTDQRGEEKSDDPLRCTSFSKGGKRIANVGTVPYKEALSLGKYRVIDF